MAQQRDRGMGGQGPGQGPGSGPGQGPGFGGGGGFGGGFGGGGGGGGGGFRGERRQVDRSEFPQWTIAPGFEHDVFTFARIRYSSRGTYGWGNRWSNDFPDSDWNFSFRLQDLTTMSVDPNGRVIELTDPTLFDYPFIFMNGVGSLEFPTKKQLASDVICSTAAS